MALAQPGLSLDAGIDVGLPCLACWCEGNWQKMGRSLGCLAENIIGQHLRVGTDLHGKPREGDPVENAIGVVGNEQHGPLGGRLEDNLWLEKGVYASNGTLVEKAVKIIEILGSKVASPDDGRAILKLSPRKS